MLGRSRRHALYMLHSQRRPLLVSQPDEPGSLQQDLLCWGSSCTLPGAADASTAVNCGWVVPRLNHCLELHQDAVVLPEGPCLLLPGLQKEQHQFDPRALQMPRSPWDTGSASAFVSAEWICLEDCQVQCRALRLR